MFNAKICIFITACVLLAFNLALIVTCCIIKLSNIVSRQDEEAAEKDRELRTGKRVKAKMSFDLELHDPVTGETLETSQPHSMRGGTYAIGGTTEMWLNITYNYFPWYYKKYAFGERGIRAICGLSGAESIPIIQKAIKGLSESREELSSEEIQKFLNQGVTGYWMPTRENAIKPLYQLLAFAQMRPDGVWKGE